MEKEIRHDPATALRRQSSGRECQDINQRILGSEACSLAELNIQNGFFSDSHQRGILVQKYLAPSAPCETVRNPAFGCCLSHQCQETKMHVVHRFTTSYRQFSDCCIAQLDPLHLLQPSQELSRAKNDRTPAVCSLPGTGQPDSA